MSRTIITNIGQLATLSGPARPRVGPELRDLALLQDAAVLVEDGRIIQVGPSAEVELLANQHDEVIDVMGRLVTPGLVDAHAHPVFASDRCTEFERRCEGATYQEIAAAGGGIRSTVRATRAASMESLIAHSQSHLYWMQSCGTTTAECKSGYGLNLETELKMLRAARKLSEMGIIHLVPTFLGAHAVPEEFAGNAAAYVDHVVNEILPVVVGEGLAEFADVFCEPAYFNLGLSRRVLGACRHAGLKLRLHADQLTLSGGAELAAELGAKTADHLEQTDTAGIRAMLSAGVQPVLLPGSVYALGHTKYPAAREMIEEGLAVVVATDFNPGSSPTPSLPMAMSLACTQMKMTPAEAISSCTINAAYSLDRGDDRGSIESGKRADLVVWDCEDVREIPYWFGLSMVHRVFVNGNFS